MGKNMTATECEEAGCEEGEEPNITILKNKNELIYKLLGYLDDDITLEVRK